MPGSRELSIYWTLNLLLYISLAPHVLGIQHMPTYTSPAGTLPHIRVMFTFLSTLLYSFREHFECCQVQNVLLRDKLALWIRSKNQRQLVNGFITDSFINLGRHGLLCLLVSPNGKCKNLQQWMFCAGLIMFLLIPIVITQHCRVVTSPTSSLISVQSTVHTNSRLTFT